MSADFWAGYISGAAGILIGNPLDVLKVQLQNGQKISLLTTSPRHVTSIYHLTSAVRGSAAPILGYGALNGLLFVSYNRALQKLEPNAGEPTNVPTTALYKIWLAGAIGGLASWTVSAPTELGGFRSFYLGGSVTLLRDSVGYGFYFWSYEVCKRMMLIDPDCNQSYVAGTLLCGGIAGIATWASIYPLDVVKTRMQSPKLRESDTKVVNAGSKNCVNIPSPRAICTARQIYREGGMRAFSRGLPACSVRAFVVNAVQWYIYETLRAHFHKQN